VVAAGEVVIMVVIVCSVQRAAQAAVFVFA
jgi:hypothetical protein